MCRRAVFFYSMKLAYSLQLHLWQIPVRSAVPLDKCSTLHLELQETNFAMSNHCLCSLHSCFADSSSQPSPHLLCNQQNLHVLFAEIATREGGEDFLGEKRSCNQLAL